MDELFNNIPENNGNGEQTEPQPQTPVEPVSEPVSTPVSEPVTEPVSAPKTEENDISGTPNGNNASTQAPNGTPYNQMPPYNQTRNGTQGTPPHQPVNIGGQAYNSTYGSNPYNAGNPSQPQYGAQRPYGTAPTMAPQPQYANPQPPKKSKPKAGKIVFITLVCICIVVASVAIGLKSEGTPSSVEATSDSAKENIAGATPSLEDSPVSYSEYSGKGTMTPEQIYNEIKEINVGILVYSKNQKVGEGSGIVVGNDSDKKYTYILTAAHVISDSGVNVQVQFSSGAEYSTEIVGFDTKTDVGVLRIEATGFKSAKFGNSDKLTVGQTVYAIGNPGGTEFFGSFTSGMISAIDRPVPTTNSSYDLPCIQHNAAINPGNSGGALVNEYGQVIGLNSSKISSTEYEGMGFSVPSATVIEVYTEIVKNGYVSNRPMLGITYFPVSSDYTYSAIAWKSDLPYGSIVIASINENSDAAKKNIQVGDIITSVNGKELESTDTLLEAIENGKVGEELKLGICRLNSNGTVNSTFEASVKLVEDKGDNTVTESQTEVDPFSSYFPNFDY